jgi:heme/copper-type cytochrome/quinol oxidase subunit 2
MPRHHRWSIVALLLTSCVSQFASAQTPPRKIVHVVAERFAFMPSEIVIEEGTLVEIHLRSDDTNHGFRIRGTRVNTIIPKRGRGAMSVWFDADAPGRYVFECSKMCGAGHSMMKGAIVVKPRSERTPSASAREY